MSVSFPYTDFTHRLHQLMEAGQQEAVRYRHSILVSLTVPLSFTDPHLLFGRVQNQERILWEQPSQKFSLVAFGATVRFTGHGEERFAQISTAWGCLLSRSLVDSPSSCPLSPPVSLGGFAFDSFRQADPNWKEYPDALLVFPRYLFISCQGSSWLSVNVLVAPGCNRQATAQSVVQALRGLLQRDEMEIKEEQFENTVTQQQDEAEVAHWKEKIASITKEIEKNTIEKLVLARQVAVSSRQQLDPGVIVSKLRSGYDHCTLFAFASNQSCFVGATPERLVRLEGKTVRTDCLAGSTNRDEDPFTDRTLGEALLGDPKERREHVLVKRALQDCLTPFCTRLSVPETPTLLHMPNVQHLYTPLEGVLKEESDIFGLVERLHPTPATGGLPQETARALIRTYEGFDRGWYAGPVGWIDGHGSGEFVVAIRSALLRGHDARLYAGCGIVTGSNPEREYAESCLKLRPMLWALSNRQN